MLTIKAGGASDVIQAADGYYVFAVSGHHPSEPMPHAEAVPITRTRPNVQIARETRHKTARIRGAGHEPHDSSAGGGKRSRNSVPILEIGYLDGRGQNGRWCFFGG